jgi:hypothetical protein
MTAWLNSRAEERFESQLTMVMVSHSGDQPNGEACCAPRGFH